MVEMKNRRMSLIVTPGNAIFQWWPGRKASRTAGMAKTSVTKKVRLHCLMVWVWLRSECPRVAVVGLAPNPAP